mgnify:FL=1|tara:strand:+ start:2437 stop:3012 length:576 start_codon:yes stop_codon:yes gene_type:complete
MSNQDSAFGLIAIGKIGQNDDNQGLSEYSIAASATAIYQNDPVTALATGTIGVAASNSTLLGTLNGVFFTDSSTGKPTFANHLAASNTATDIVGFVSDDPYERFVVQVDTTFAAADVFLNANITYVAGASPNFVSNVELAKGSLTTTSTHQLKVVGISKDPDNNDVSSANPNVVVRMNNHTYAGGTGTVGL